MENAVNGHMASGNTAIAVIGMSCRFPGASNYEEFWENLKAGRSSIEEVPKNRWDWEAYWGDPKTEKNKSNSKWGGFLKGADNFDPDFFGLSVKEVESMDPQQRIMLELTWSCFEDAGIRPADVSGKKVGVFLGVFNFDYKELQERNLDLSIEAHHSTGTASALIANRISYYFNFKGPSLPIDTACSSSLTAIHSSIQSLLQGECTMAVAGGINLLLTPTRHISFSKTGMLSPTGSCKTFDDAADGYVRGEGAGLVLLKPLAQALADNDPVYGVIRGSAVNHGGKTYSLTYPNPKAQQDVINDAQRMAGITSESMSYIEMHGTGTPKGDPIEFQGLMGAFQPASSESEAVGQQSYCGLGSVKTNVGHLEAAAGVAGIIKVLLSMKYKQLPGLQNFTRLNHRISMDNTPFYLVTKLQEWKALKDNTKELPRRAGVSSFGFGGTNAHVVLEEVMLPEMVTQEKEGYKKPPFYMVCFSAKAADNLIQKEKDLRFWLAGLEAEVPIEDICKTLSVGREHFRKRSVLLVRDAQELLDKLQLLSAQASAEGYFSNLSEHAKEPDQQLFIEIGRYTTEALNSSREIIEEDYYHKLIVLAELYLKGYDPDWEAPWFGQHGRRIGMPAYPFARNRYWIPDLNIISPNPPVNGSAPTRLHPLLGQNISDFLGQKFSTTLTGKDSFIKDHVVKGKQVLPAVCYLEMVRAAIIESGTYLQDAAHSMCLKNVTWIQPAIVGVADLQLEIALFIEKDDVISFDVFSQLTGNEEEPVIYSQGSARFEAVALHDQMDINKLRESCNGKVYLKDACYSCFRQMGFDYGVTHQGLEALYTGSGKQLAKLRLPSVIHPTTNLYVLQPGLMDAALQACLLVETSGAEDSLVQGLYLPFALEHLEIIKPCTAEMWAVITPVAGRSSQGETQVLRMFDVDVCDAAGTVCVSMKRLSFKLVPDDFFQKAKDKKSSAGESTILLLEPVWQKEAVATGKAAHDVQHLVFLCEPGNIPAADLAGQLPDTRFIVLQEAQKNIAHRFQHYAQRVFEEIQTLLKNKPKGKVFVQIVVPEDAEKIVFTGLSGFLKTAGLENPHFIGQLVRVPTMDGIIENLREIALQKPEAEVRSIEGKWILPGWREVVVHPDQSSIPWKDKGVYLITGGAGGLGLIFAKNIVARVKNPVLFLTGRSPLSSAQMLSVNALRLAGAEVEYRQVDIGNEEGMTALIKDILSAFKGLNGIIHSAGIVQDNFIIKKSTEELMAVLSPKVLGVTCLDEITKEIPLDFFILFSSIVGPKGNVGQADYAAANSYLDAYAGWRNHLTGLHKRFGHTIAINWPLWKDGGMQLEKGHEVAFLEEMKMDLLETAAGIEALYSALGSGASQIMVVPRKAEILPSITEEKLMEESHSGDQSLPEFLLTEDKAVRYFKELLSATIKRPVEQIAADAAMEEYGIDSILVMQMTAKMESVFGALPKTLFFEYQDIQELTGYFLENYGGKLEELLGTGKPPVANKGEEAAVHPLAEIVRDKPLLNKPILSRERPPLQSSPQRLTKDMEGAAPLDIAIIGMAGRYPQASNLQEFWDNLCKGKDCITEIPAQRWDYHPYFDEDKEAEGKSYSKWGGFLNDVDKFDPLFFNISPLEAERMDPQERLFLQCVYETIEDAGYTRHSVSEQKHFGLSNQVGVYVGVMYEEYQLFGAQETLAGNPVAVWGLPSSIANRVSYFCDFHGPSMAIDTMCSSSLTAIHLACESIVRGKCEVAVAGGVNVSIHPNKYLFLSQGRFASSKGRCESFGIGGDGYVPGEGVGSVLLKPLEKAIADGDHIYGVIKSTAINHGGKTNGYTVPNPKAQASTISRAFKESGINPRTISYLEAHGTGTSLGDPIEILGLSKSMQEYTKDTQFCAIGSVKSNIGHCESAAGIAGITKVLLQMKYRQIVPSLHSEVLNANIDFGDSPFVVQQELSAWKRPVAGENDHAREYPLRAGISSFGAGGSNAHIVIEEYIQQSVHKATEPVEGFIKEENSRVILLSATDENRLEEQARQLLNALSGDTYWNLSNDLLADMAYTLQIGREHLGSRLALLVSSVTELRQKIEEFLSGKQQVPGLFQGQVNVYQGKDTVVSADEDMDETIEGWLQKKQYDKVVERWVKGLKVDWRMIYGDVSELRRISMPTYPFKKDRFWVGEAGTPGTFQTGKNKEQYIHPLLHENISDWNGPAFRVVFSGDEFYLKDHRVNGQKILPAAAYLEMIRAAIAQSVKNLNVKLPAIKLENITWFQPIIVDEEGKTIEIELYLKDDGNLGFEVCSAAADEPDAKDIFCSGSAALDGLTAIATIGEAGINLLRRECDNRELSKTICYEAFEKIGFQYGVLHQGIEEAFIGNNKVVVKIALPSSAFGQKELFYLHPGLLDAALQATLLWNYTGDNDALKMYLPTAVAGIEIYDAIPDIAWVVISMDADGWQKNHAGSDERLLNIDVLTTSGTCCVRLSGVSLKTPSSGFLSGSGAKKPFETLLFHPVWEEKKFNQAGSGKSFDKRIVLLCGLKDNEHELASSLPETEILVLEDHGKADFQFSALQAFEKVRALLKEKGDILVQVFTIFEESEGIFAGISGLLKTAQKENPRFWGQVIRVSGNESVQGLLAKIGENGFSGFDKEVRYRNDNREVFKWHLLPPEAIIEAVQQHPWKDKGVYLITGGAGGLGLIIAREIAQKANAVTLVLTGRSAWDKSRQTALDVLQKLGARVQYRQVDVSEKAGVEQLIDSIVREFGSLQGIIHSAGVIKDNFLIQKTNAEWNAVLAPKVAGIQNLDLASKDISLDVFIFFSSITGAVGNAGQADYATANAFMDEYAEYRNNMVANGLRSGQTLSLNWPLWQEGGMLVDKDTEQYLFDSMGITPLPTKAAIDALYKALASKHARVLVVHGDRKKIFEKIISERQPEEQQTKKTVAPALATDHKIVEEAIHYFKKLLSAVIKLPVDQIKPDISLEEYGIDSVMVMKMTAKLEKVFGNLSKTLFFEYQNIRQLTAYFVEQHYTGLAAILGIADQNEVFKKESVVLKKMNFQDMLGLNDKRKKLSNAFEPSRIASPSNVRESLPVDVAIVGVSGRYPQADNLEQFWENLCQGKDCITEVPHDRWDYSAYFDADKNKAGKTYSKWGGFINGVDEFDSLLFNISPKEAELLDPQERLFLQCVYETMEDAGYNRQALAADHVTGLSGNVGVYVGVMYEEYQLLGAEESMKGRNIALFGNPSSIANRVSYFYNLNGPSMAIDTMCSSSLTAIHLACQAIQNGDCKAAIAGGVNISIHPNKYLLLAQGKFISSKGRCESFGIGGDGYVPSEGVGSVFLKPLSQAIADGDHIYGVIKATAVNHGGKTNGYTVPNPNAQAQVIKKAYQRSAIDPRTISYLEAHGTGTSLGDPIEITGLKKVYQEYTTDHHFCAIGSVKSNIGHGESAAGIAGLTKILLQLKHRQIVPSLHSGTLNPHIDFVNSPFVVQQELTEWKRPVIAVNGKDREFLRRAGISSFGAGGSNAHLIIEEFDESLLARASDPSFGENVAKGHAVILLSAKNSDRLKQSAERLLHALQKGSLKDTDLNDIAFTLQTGRDALEVRLAMEVRSVDDLHHKLASFLRQGNEGIDDLYYGKIEKDNGAIDAFAADEELQEAVGKWLARKKYAKLCAFWVRGLSIDWSVIYQQEGNPQRHPKRISLPAYPFAREHHWISRTEDTRKLIQSTENSYKLLTYEEEWTEQPLELAMSDFQHHDLPSIRTVVCFLSDVHQQELVRKEFQAIKKDIVVVFISRNEVAGNSSSYFLDSEDGHSYRKTIKTITETYGKIGAFIYLWALEEQKFVTEPDPVIYLLQAIGKEGLKDNRVLLAGQWQMSDLLAASVEQCYLESWIGFVRSNGQVLPQTLLSVLYQEQEGIEVDFVNWTKLIWQELQLPENHEALYKKGKRYNFQIRKTNISAGSPSIKQGGTYLITGGMGGLGLLIAQHLSEKYRANLVLTGRSPVDHTKQQAITALKHNGCKVRYIQADVCDIVLMQEELAAVRQEMGAIDGVIHAAGTEEAGTLMDRSLERFLSVLASKIKGTLALDTLLKDEQLSFVCYFSSSAAILGDFGSCDYSVGNRFQMAFARYRNALVHEGKRKGKTIAINWPLWRDGGMNLQETDSTQLYLVSSGQRYLETQEGIDLFEQLLSGITSSHQLVLAGKENKTDQFLGLTLKRSPGDIPPVSSLTSSIKSYEAGEGESVAILLEATILQYAGELLKLSKDQLDSQENLADLGFDSVSLTQLASVLSRHFSIAIVPALFFSYPTIEKLTRYFIKEHYASLSGFFSHRSNGIAAEPVTPVIDQEAQPSPLNEARSQGSYEPIAIIGMSGRFPQALNIEEMWQILAEGRNVVTEIPADRFDWRLHYGGENIEDGKTNCKWSGFIPGVREFDPLFFEISPAEAKLMDPRQRLLLQEGWKALEDAGYGKIHFEHNKVGLFVGVEEGNYASLSKQAGSVTENSNAILAARLSYFLNLSGPNMAINTACSSGLVAAHQAFQSLQNRECDTAVAAGVNLLIAPEPYISMSQAGMLSSDGTCHTFDKHANGMVPGEAVTVVVLKRLSDAIAAGDPVYATITGSGINYDGKTNGITSPGGLSQTDLIKSVYDRYGVNPENIEYIVTHGTGTRLGDPVEVNALYDAFKGYTDKQGYCALTSAKTNFGHTFAASGLVSLINLVQALRHETIPASLHCDDESDYINWKNSPFFVNKTPKPWPAVPDKLRSGAVSAFGMSGTNAHMVVQSYVADRIPAPAEEHPWYFLPLSAKTDEALQKKIEDMILFLESNEGQVAGMKELSYTLLTGRFHFKHRCVVVARNRIDAIRLLKHGPGREQIKNRLQGEVARTFKANHETKEALVQLAGQCQGSKRNAQLLEEILLALGGYYIRGHELLWEKLFPDEHPRRIHLPTYPFSKKEYWISKDDPHEQVFQSLQAKPNQFSREEFIMPAVEVEKPTVIMNKSVNRLESIIEQWVSDKEQGNAPGFEEINYTISVEEMSSLDASSIEKIYNLCFEEQSVVNTESPVTVVPEKIFDHIQLIRSAVIAVLQIEDPDDDEPFQQYGLDSIKAMKLATRLGKKLQINFQPQWFMEFPTIYELAQYLTTEY